MRRARRVAVVSALLLAMITPAAASAAIKVEGSNDTHYFTVKKLRCKVTKDGFLAASRNIHGWRLGIWIHGKNFKGFDKEYVVEYSSKSPTDVFAFHTGTQHDAEGNFSNVHDPTEGKPGPQLTDAGSVAFPKNKKTLGVALPLVYDRPNSEAEYASVIGDAECKYVA
jgi:hypothetical protein